MIAFDPTQTIDFCLGEKLLEPSPAEAAFTTRFLTCRQYAAMWRAYQAAYQSDDVSGDAVISAFVEGLRGKLVGWRNVFGPDGAPVPFDLDRLPDVLTPTELRDLFLRTRWAASLSASDRKKSASPLGSPGPSGDAIPAATAPANAG